MCQKSSQRPCLMAQETKNKKKIQKNLVTVGDGECGKTCLMVVFTQNHFPEDYTATDLGKYGANITVDGKQVNRVFLEKEKKTLLFFCIHNLSPSPLRSLSRTTINTKQWNLKHQETVFVFQLCFQTTSSILG